MQGIKNRLRMLYNRLGIIKSLKEYQKKFFRYSFIDCRCDIYEQFEASVTRLYHTLEKGMCYNDYRAGFGKGNVDKIITSLEQYVSRGYDPSAFFYETALSCLYAYIQKNRQHGYEDEILEERIKRLPGKANKNGGVINVSAPNSPQELRFDQLMASRHSIRHFSEEPVDLDLLKEVIEIARFTPSACNRQEWITRVVCDKNKVNAILANQNGNKGFGQEFDKLIVITADLRAQQRSRELFQTFIDGGMFAESVLNGLFSKGIGSVPLSAALLPKQEKKVRELLNINDAEMLILFIGVGNYPKGEFLTARSERRPAKILFE